MSDAHTNPPRWASALLGLLLRPSDSEAIPGDLLEEYRDVRYPSLGARRADFWYVTQVLGMLWRLVWPCAAAMAALRILAIPLPRGWNPSLVQAPGLSLLDGVCLFSAGYYASQRTGRIATGIVISTFTNALGIVTLFAYASAAMPSLLLAPFEKPFIVVILSIVLAMALGFGIVLGAMGGAAGRWLPPNRWKARAS